MAHPPWCAGGAKERRVELNPSAQATPHPRWLRVAAIVLGSLALALFFQCPRLWIFSQPVPGSVYWDRGLQFIQQCDAPLGAPLADAALAWRVAPVLLAKTLALHGRAALAVPWIGLVLLLAQCAWVMAARTRDWRAAAFTTALIATTGATATVTSWLGINDAWYAAALVAIALQPSAGLLLLAAAIGPWVDERFILALPLALWVRHQALGAAGRIRVATFAAAASIGAYLALRLGNVLHLSGASSEGYWRYVLGGIPAWWPWVSLGWFMGLRAAWVWVAVAIGGGWRKDERRAAWFPALLAAAPLAVMSVLASDTSRSPTMLLPLVLFGVERFIALRGIEPAIRIARFLLVANLLMPAMNVTYRNADPVNMLPVELARWARVR
ncbi:MAG: hypothetical protein JWM88_3307 [Verrucomicrobia bacterium]|nr:hypothetical protein [Verrucomicrobiota bacterium]